ECTAGQKAQAGLAVIATAISSTGSIPRKPRRSASQCEKRFRRFESSFKWAARARGSLLPSGGGLSVHHTGADRRLSRRESACPAQRVIHAAPLLSGTPEQVRWFNDLQRMTTSPLCSRKCPLYRGASYPRVVVRPTQ